MEFISYYSPFSADVNIFHFWIEWGFLLIIDELKIRGR